ncbi:hypothetical protein BDZ45DRAFT_749779 [Acephala macrosclerotiorum]|nr:hypothetical protein BDZ45DRAFT_749779 [Acephala macrosclerotiorum]
MSGRRVSSLQQLIAGALARTLQLSTTRVRLALENFSFNAVDEVVKILSGREHELDTKLSCLCGEVFTEFLESTGDVGRRTIGALGFVLGCFDAGLVDDNLEPLLLQESVSLICRSLVTEIVGKVVDIWAMWEECDSRTGSGVRSDLDLIAADLVGLNGDIPNVTTGSDDLTIKCYGIFRSRG